MRKHIKQRCVEILNTTMEVHYLIAQDLTQKGEYLELCKEGINAISNSIITGIPIHVELNQSIEEYATAVEEMIIRESIDVQDLIYIDNIAAQLIQEISAIKDTYQVVFFPYNASMWDSLESIYLECKKDENCECLVVPIPYYKFNRILERWEYTYEGQDLPEEVPVIHYTKYSLEDSMPDIAYIHNPYDEYNLITRVDSKYFSYNLKKYADILVYVPYYIASGEHQVAEHEFQIRAYKHVDYIVAQSENYKEYFKHMPYYNKILPLGSPKVDRIIHMCKQEKDMNEEWREVIGDKKVIMLNLTIYSILRYGAAVLKKIEELFREIEKEDIVLLWRPHPLIKATLNSLSVHLKDQYEGLVNYFINKKLGIFDETPDITKSVAICDAYIGCGSSSVVNLFRAVKKPIYYMNYDISYNIEDHKKVNIVQLERYEDRNIITTHQCNALFITDNMFGDVKYLPVSSKEIYKTASYCFEAIKQNEVYLTPLLAKGAQIYDLKRGEMKEIGALKEDFTGYGYTIAYENKIIYLPWLQDKHIKAEIIIYNSETKSISKHSKCIRDWKKNAQEQIYANSIRDYKQVGNSIYMCAQDTGDVLKFDIEKNTYEIIKISDIGYSCLCVEGDYIWLADALTGEVIEYNMKLKTKKIYTMPAEFVKARKMDSFERVHGYLFKVGDFIIALPMRSNMAVKIDLRTGQSKPFIKSFFEDEFDENGMQISCNFAKRVDTNTLLVQRNKDKRLAEINVEKEIYITYDIEMDDDIFEKFMNEYDEAIKNQYYIAENIYFPIARFIQKVSQEKIVVCESKESVQKFISNMDGTCGKNIHKYIMNVLYGGT